MELRTKESFSVIGKEGSTEDGTGFIGKLWEEADAHFAEVQDLAKKDETGTPVGFWGAMSDFSRSFLPWEENFSRGLYLAGVECDAQAEPPAGWVKWSIPAFEYLCVEGTDNAFSEGLCTLREKGLSLAGAVQDFTDPRTGKPYMLFPVRRL